MFCPQCGKEGGETHQFCASCGSTLQRSASVPEARQRPAPAATSRGMMGAFVTVALIVLIAALGLVVWNQQRALEQSRRPLGALANLADDASMHGAANALRGVDQSLHPSGWQVPTPNISPMGSESVGLQKPERPALQRPAPPSPTAPVQQTTMTPHSGFNSFKFFTGTIQVPARGTAGRTIKPAPGSTDNEIVGRFDARGGLKNDIRVFICAEDDPGTLLYDSGQKNWGMIDVRDLDPEKSYVVVFDNRSSVFSGKTVTANLALTFIEP